MIKALTVLAFLASLTLLGAPAAGSEKHSNSKAMHQMAEIMVDLNHRPSDSGKEVLEKIIKDDSSTEYEQILANAILNLNHKPAGSDKPKLEKLMNDGSASSSMREMASILYNLNHKPTADDKEKLRKMMK